MSATATSNVNQSGLLIFFKKIAVQHLVSDTRTVPEFLGPDCRAEPIGAALNDVLDFPQGQLKAMELTMKRLGDGGDSPGLRAARAVLSRL